jgi:Zn-dependent protease
LPFSSNTLYTISVWVLPLVIAITFHEAAHGFVAHHFGDNTARERGRVSFNPLKHIDPFGTLILPAVLLLSHSPFLFGYAKPVPVNFRALRQPRIDMVWVALAGPATNIVLALCAAAAFPSPGLRSGGRGAVDCRQSQKRPRYQRRARNFQHASDPAAGRRTGRGGVAA